MNVLNPWAVFIGIGLVGLPVLVHLLTRPRPERFPFSAMRFLESVLRQRRFLSRLRDILVLLVRTLAIAAVALAFARPLMQGALRSSDTGDARRLVILDVSRSMDARAGGVGVAQRARARALEHLRSAPGRRANLILAGARSEAAFERFSANFPALQTKVRTAEIRQEQLDAKAAMDMAARLFSDEDSKGARSELVIISDLQESNWKDINREGIPDDVDIIVENVGLARQPDNLAIARVSAAGRPQIGRPVRISVEVRNYAQTDQTCPVELAANDKVWRQDLLCPAGATAVASFDATMPTDTESGSWISGNARLLDVQDALPADDVRHYAFQVGCAPVFAMVSRDDCTDVGTSVYFLGRMLCPGSLDSSSGTLQRAIPGSDPAAILATNDMIVLHKPGRLDASWTQMIASLLLRGRPVLYVVSEPLDAENITAIETACNDGLKLPVQFTAWMGSGSGTGDADDRLVLRDLSLLTPPFSAFGDKAAALSADLSATRILRTLPVLEADATAVSARWSDGSAALVSAHAGHGEMVIWNLDLAHSTAPHSTFFVAALREQTSALLTDPTKLNRSFDTGMSALVPLPPTIGRITELSLYAPDGDRVEDFECREERSGPAWRWTTIGPPGVYRIMRGTRVVFAAASSCPAEESDLHSLSSGAFQEQLSSDETGTIRTAMTLVGQPGEPVRTDAAEFWWWLLVAALCLVLVELILLKAFRI